MSVKIGIIGLGTVGGGVYEILRARKELIDSRSDSDIVVAKVCDRRPELSEELGIPEEIFTDDYNEIIDDDDIQLIVMLTGNAELAFDIVKRAFAKKKHVVTANKELMARRWNEIFRLTRENGCLIYFEASVGSGIPVLQGINEGLASNEICSIEGILNGTTNYVLSLMAERSCSFETAIEKAIAEGFAEPDYEADVSGKDSLYKLCVLINLVSSCPVDVNDVYREGIENIGLEDIRFARDMLSLDLKLVSIMKKTGTGMEARVHPSLIPKNDMLYSVSYENNGIIVEGDSVGPVMFYGKGAGRFPAASAVVSDIIFLSQKIEHGTAGEIPYIKSDISRKAEVISMDSLSFQYYLRIDSYDKPGVLAKITGILGDKGISISSFFQKSQSNNESVPVIMVTHMALEKNMMEAVSELEKLEDVVRKPVYIRIESKTEVN
jgi:homoserine dehydrogenase